MNVFDDKGFAAASIRNVLGNYGKLAMSKSELPLCGKVVRINTLGFTLSTELTDVLPYDKMDLYIGRKQINDGKLSIRDFVVYVITDIEKDQYLYLSSDSLPDHICSLLANYYTYVNNHKNYHGMYFRSVIESYKLTHAGWDINTEKTFGDLKPMFDIHYALAKNLNINRFNTELSALEDFYCWAGFLNISDKKRYPI